MSKIMNEYDSLRNELISFEEQQRSVWIYMYVLFIALFVLGIEFSYSLFLVTYIILIPFQAVMNRYNMSITRISTYIRLFYENDSNKLNWECLQIYDEYKKYNKKHRNSISGMVRFSGVSQLGLLATSFYIFNLLSLRYNNNIFNLNAFDIFFIMVSICLFILTIILNIEYNKNVTDDLQVIIQQYKNELSDCK